MAYPADPVELRGAMTAVSRLRPVPSEKPRYVVTAEVEVEVYEPSIEEAIKEAIATLDSDASVVSCAILAVRLEAT